MQGPTVDPTRHPRAVVPPHESLVEVTAEEIHLIRQMKLMETVDALGVWIGEHYVDDALKVETRDRYLVESDEADFQAWQDDPAVGPDMDAKQGWLDWLTTHPFRNLHILDSTAMTDYLRFELAWCYPDNVDAGADTRILDVADPQLAASIRELALSVDDTHVVGGRAAVVGYDRDGRFLHAREINDPARLIAATEQLWEAAEDFRSWWAHHPELHGAARRAA